MKSSEKKVAGRVQSGSKTRPKKAVAAKKDAAPGLKPASVKRVRNYRKLAKKELSEAFPDIVDVLVERAKEGSLTHTKFLFEIGGGKDEPMKRGARKQRNASLAEMLLEEVAKRRQEPGETSGADAVVGEK